MDEVAKRQMEEDRAHVRAAWAEAVKRYPEAERGLTFFYVAAGLGRVEQPSPEAIKWAQEQIARRMRNLEQKSDEKTVACGQCETQVVFGACCPICGKPTDE